MKNYIGERIAAPSEEYLEGVQAAWHKFIATGELNRDALRPIIADSWERCAKLGTNPVLRQIDKEVSSEERERRMSACHGLIEVARPFLGNLYNALQEVELIIILTDRDGFIIHIMGEGYIKDLCTWAGLVPGQFWTDETVGTTAPSEALISGQPVQVVAEEHWNELAKGCTCAAAPIRGIDDEIIGVLDITALYEEAGAHLHTFGMAIAAAKAIETAMKLQATSDQLNKANKFLTSAIQSIPEGLILLNRDLKVINANHVAEKLTGSSLGRGEPVQRIVKEAKDIKRIRNVLIDCSGFFGQELIFGNGSGVEQRFIVNAEPVLDKGRDCIGVLLVLQELRRVRKLAQKMYGAHAIYTFNDLVGRDGHFHLCVKNTKLAAKSDCPIVITGESGTGKEMFAQAIHNYSNRHDGPFLPINCAAIPRDLLESELFGYEEGAFTGAKKGGNPGKFELADKGTLFLDEIDSMPLDLQAKLLRVIEDKRVVRLGGMSFIPVDVRIVAASCKDLRQRIREDGFRSDLFFRISVVNVNIPPLRERRGDIPLLARHFVMKYAKSAEEAKRYLQPTILATLQANDWPGNVRELSNWAERILTIGQEVSSTSSITPLPDPQTGNQESAPSNGGRAKLLGDAEAEIISKAIADNRFNLSRTAADLGISRSTLYRKMEKYNL